MTPTINLTAVQTIYALENNQFIHFLFPSVGMMMNFGNSFSPASLQQLQDWLIQTEDDVSEDDITLLSIYLAETFSRISQKFYHWAEHTGTRFTQFYSENESDLQNVFFIELVRNTLQTKLPTLLNSIAESLNINQHIDFEDTQSLPALKSMPDRSHLQKYQSLTGKQKNSFFSQCPQWCTVKDPLNSYFDDIEDILKHGHQIRGQIVQANNLLFKPNYVVGCPAEIIYDLQNKLTEDDLSEISSYLFSLREKTDLNETEQKLADHLNNEMERVIGELLPMELFGYPIYRSTIYIDQTYLPTGVLLAGNLPILIAPEITKQVMLLPALLWNNLEYSAWKSASFEKFGREITLEKMIMEAVDQLPEKSKRLSTPVIVFIGIAIYVIIKLIASSVS